MPTLTRLRPDHNNSAGLSAIVGSDGIDATLKILKYPRQFVRRIDGRVTIDSLVIRRSTTLDIDLSSSPLRSTRVLIPILLPAREHLVDNLTARDSAGTPLRILTHAEHTRIASSLIAAQFALEGVRSSSLRKKGAELFEILTDIPQMSLARARDTVALLFGSEPRRKYHSPSARHRVSARRLLEVTRTSSALKFLLQTFSEQYLVLAEAFVDDIGCASIEFSYDAPYFERRLTPKQTVAERVRDWLGLAPFSYLLFVGRGLSQAESFNLRVDGLPGHYLHQSKFLAAERAQGVEALHTLSEGRLRELTQHPGEMIIQDVGSPVPYAHLFTSGFKRHGLTVFGSVTFFERPPGSVGLAFMAAAIALMPLLVILICFRGLFEGKSVVSADVPALLTALPGLLAFVITPRLETRQLTTAPMSAYIGLVASVVFCLFGALTLVATQGSLSLVVFQGTPLSVKAIEVGQAVFGLFTISQLVLVVFLARRLHANIQNSRARR